MTSKRRANGEGSIYQRRDGRWVASFPLGKTHDGKRQRIVRYAKTKKEAVREWFNYVGAESKSLQEIKGILNVIKHW